MRLSPAVRISLGLISLTISLLLLGKLIGFAPDRTRAILDSRKNLSEALAIQFSAAAQRGDLPLIRETLKSMVVRNNDIKSVAVRSTAGELLAEAGNHLAELYIERAKDAYLQTPHFVLIDGEYHHLDKSTYDRIIEGKIALGSSK